jgi:acetyl esterase/lipase
MKKRLAVVLAASVCAAAVVLFPAAGFSIAIGQAPPAGAVAAQSAGASRPKVTPTHADLAYAPAEPPGSNGHKLDLYLPAGAARPVPVVVWTGGSAWMADTGKRTAGRLAGELLPAGYAVAGVSIRSSSQVRFPGQLHDIKAAIRWLRTNAARYNIDPAHIGIMGDSSGGWTTAMAATTGDAPAMEGNVGVGGVSSAVQAAVAFYPPTDFLSMDFWALEKCAPKNCHDGEASPESRLVGCAIQTCPERVRAADPAAYVTEADPPIMILHGNSDPLVPHNQGERLYMALNKACREAIFISLPKAGHGSWAGFLTDDGIREGATIRSTTASGCTVANPTPLIPSWNTVTSFLHKHLRPGSTG